MYGMYFLFVVFCIVIYCNLLWRRDYYYHFFTYIYVLPLINVFKRKITADQPQFCIKKYIVIDFWSSKVFVHLGNSWTRPVIYTLCREQCSNTNIVNNHKTHTQYKNIFPISHT